MEGIIKVSPQKLMNTASEFGTQGGQIEQYTRSMMELINQLRSSWEGEASNAYITRFSQLEGDITRIIAMVKEHSSDLQEMAHLYSTADQQNSEEASALLGSVIE